MAGDKKQKARSIGLTIRLPQEGKNPVLELRKHFEKFSNRLDTFMALSHLVIVTPGGIGTILELFYTLQLIQVKHINKIPIILVGKVINLDRLLKVVVVRVFLIMEIVL
jgi:predicted Rossmann-fold nucleotide-binding protein